MAHVVGRVTGRRREVGMDHAMKKDGNKKIKNKNEKKVKFTVVHDSVVRQL
jgi:hypothetical protein